MSYNNRKCWVPNCSGGYDKTKQNHISVFKAPNDVNRLELWRKNIPRGDRLLTSRDVICERHFIKENIIREWRSGSILVPLSRPRLAQDAIPTIFPNCRSYLNKTAKKRKLQVKSTVIPLKKQKTNVLELPVEENVNECASSTITNISLFLQLFNEESVLNLPNHWALTTFTRNDSSRVLIISEVIEENDQPVLKRQIVINEKLKMDFFIYGHKAVVNGLLREEIWSIQDIEQIVETFLKLKICPGGPNTNNYNINSSKISVLDKETGNWRHKSCCYILQEQQHNYPVVGKMSVLEYSQDTIKEEYHTYKDVQCKTFICDKSTPEVYQCKCCDFKTDLLIFLKKHIQQIHLTNNEEGNESQIVEYTSQSFICGNCTFETYSSLHWLKHVKTGCSSIEAKIPCQGSHVYSTINKTNLGVHVTRTLECYRCGDDEADWFKCNHCKYKSKFSSNLRNQKNFRHTTWKDTDLFHCHKCSYKTKWKNNLKRHNIRLHLASKEIEWFQCSECSFKTETNESLKQNNIILQSVPEEIQWFQCDKCSYKTKHKSYLKEHNIRLHLVSEEIQCDKCSYKTKIKSDLKRQYNSPLGT